MFDKNLLLQHIQNRQRTIEEQLIGIGDADAPQTKPKKKDPNKPTDAGMLSVEPPEDLAVDNTRGTAGTRPISDMELNYLIDPTAREAYMRARRENPNANEAEAFGAAADTLRQGVIDRGRAGMGSADPEDVLNVQRAADLVVRERPISAAGHNPVGSEPYEQTTRMNAAVRSSRMTQDRLRDLHGTGMTDAISEFERRYGRKGERGLPTVQWRPTNEQVAGIPSAEAVSRTIQPVVARRQYLDHAIDDNKIKDMIDKVAVSSRNFQNSVDDMKASGRDKSPTVKKARAGEFDLPFLPKDYSQLDDAGKMNWHIERAKSVIRNNMITTPDEQLRDYKREDSV